MTRASGPAWSIVVPTFNRPLRLASCARALAALDPPPGGFEIVIVNDGGTPPDADTKSAAASGSALDVRVITRQNGGPAAARNEGATCARGRAVAFTDDDCEPASDWLVALDTALAAAPDALIGGAVANGLATNLFSEASQQFVQFVMEWFDGVARERFFTSNNIGVQRAAFLEVGGFDESFILAGEDREFCDRWHAAGRPSLREPRAHVRHFHDLGLGSFLRQHFTYGVWGQNFRRVRGGSGRPTRIDPAFYASSLRHALRARPPWRGVTLAFLTGVAHAAYAAGLTSSRLRGPGRASGRTARHPGTGNQRDGE